MRWMQWGCDYGEALVLQEGGKAEPNPGTSQRTHMAVKELSRKSEGPVLHQITRPNVPVLGPLMTLSASSLPSLPTCTQ